MALVVVLRYGRQEVTGPEQCVGPASREGFKGNAGLPDGAPPFGCGAKTPEATQALEIYKWNTEKLQDLAKSIVRVYNSMQSLNCHCKSHLAATLPGRFFHEFFKTTSKLVLQPAERARNICAMFLARRWASPIKRLWP